MSLKEEICAASEKEIEAIMSAADKNAGTIRRNAKMKADQDFSEAQNQTDRQNERAVRILQSEAEMKCRAESGQFLEQLLTQLKEKIKEIMRENWSAQFEEIVTASVISGAEKIRSDQIAVELPEAFHELFSAKENQIRAALEEKKISIISAAFTLHSVCGIIITNKEGRKLVTDTAEENIRRIEDELRITIAERIGYGG